MTVVSTASRDANVAEVSSLEQDISAANSPEFVSTLVNRYFEGFNAGKFHQVAGLFAPDGHLYPPFESPIIGREAISGYLVAEAEGMEAEPISFETHELDMGRTQIEVTGKVTALVFKVNVVWQFILTAKDEIESVRVDLLASLEELLKIRPSAASLDP